MGACKVEFLEELEDPNSHLNFIAWFVSAWRDSGGAVRKNLLFPHKIKAFFGRLPFGRIFPIGKTRLVVCGCHRIESMAWPWNWFYEIVPMMWDLWPGNYAQFKRFARINRIKIAFCSSSQSTDWINRNCSGVKAYWLPEGLAISRYPMGGCLRARNTDVLSYGRVSADIQTALTSLSQNGDVKVQIGAGRTIQELSRALRNARITIAFPLCDTNPAKAQGVETLTIRYWEAMLSGTLIIGRSPSELIEVCGYDPVIPAGAELKSTIREVLADLVRYQELAIRNRNTAEARASWTDRLEKVKCVLDEAPNNDKVSDDQ